MLPELQWCINQLTRQNCSLTVAKYGQIFHKAKNATMQVATFGILVWYRWLVRMAMRATGPAVVGERGQPSNTAKHVLLDNCRVTA